MADAHLQQHRREHPRRVAVVMSGGGARGAYEAGVLSYVLDDLQAKLRRPVHFDIVTGTSVGAVHACYLAASQQAPADGARLLELWRSLSLDAVFALGASEADLLSYQLFDRCYADHLIDLGRHDAAAAADELVEFFT